MWKFHDFSIIQILREINFGDSWWAKPKSAILSHLEALNFDSYEFLHFLKAENDQKSKPKVSKIANNGIFWNVTFSKIDFT